MRRIIFLEALLLSLAVTLIRFSPPSAVRALAGGSAFTPVAAPQAQTPKPIRTLPGLEEIRVWLGPNIIVDYSFGPNHIALTERRATLDSSSFDMRPPAPEGRVQFYDIFYSNADGTLNADGAYLTIEAVSYSQAQGEGGGNVAEVGLRSFGSTTFEYGNAVAGVVTVGANANANSISNAIDGNTQTYTTLGNVVGYSGTRLRITIGFSSSSGLPGLPTLTMNDITVTEGDTGTTPAVFTLTLQTFITLPVSVNFATDDTDYFFRDRAIAGSDYVSTSGTLTIPPGERSAQIRVPIIGDTVAEETKYFRVICRVVLTGLGNAETVISASCRILDNDRTVFQRCSGDLSLPVTNPSTLTATMSIAENIVIQKLTVGLFIETENAEDIRVELKSPSGESALIFVKFSEGRNIGAGCNPNELCVLDQEADNSIRFNLPPFVGRFNPKEGYNGTFLNTFRDENARGDWTLIVTNTKSSNIATLRCWCLGVEGTLTGCVLKPNGLTFQTHTFVTPTATVLSNGAPVRGADVTFSIFDRLTTPRGTFGPFQTNQNGQAMMTPYTNSVDEFGKNSISLVQLIRAEVTINGTPFAARAVIKWRENECPIATQEQGALHAEATLAAAHAFRDNVLSQTSRGRGYTDLYYQFSSEAVQIMMFNPMLMLRSRAIIERYKPVIQSMASGEEVTLTDGDLGEIDDFLKSFSFKGSPELQEAIGGLRLDLRDPLVHSEFRIKSTNGHKRELPAGTRTATIKQVGFITSLFGLFAFAISATRSRLKRLRADFRRLTGLALVALLVGSQWPVAGAKTDLVAAAAQSPIPVDHRATTVRDDTELGDLPMLFEVNQGQMDSKVKFLARGSGYDLFLTATETAMILRREKAKGKRQTGEIPEQPAAHSSPSADVLRMRLVGAAPNPQVSGLDQLPAVSNYFIGSDTRKWRAAVSTYAKVKYEDVYPRVDMVYYGNQGELEYDFIVAPGGDPRAIKMQFDGADRMETDAHGDLVLQIGGGQLRQRKPTVYQEVSGARHAIPGRYIIGNTQSAIRNQQLGFEIGAYDTTKPLIIDPVLAYSTYIGGRGDDEGNAITVDSAGNVYLVGFTDSINFPTSNPSQPTLGGAEQDVFVSKLNPSGTQVIYSTYLGGDGQDNGSGIALDSAGNAYITGFTGSTNFPVRNALQPAKNGQFNAFVAKLDPTGSLLYSTHLGGSLGDYGSSITVDSSGNIYVAGVATSSNFPMVNALQPIHGGAADLYVAKLNPAGTQLVYSTYLGGAADDGATSIAVDSAGNVYLTGVTSSRNFRTMNPLQASHGGGLFDAFVAKVNPSGSQLVYSTYLGGSGEDRAFRIAVDSAGNAYVTGDTDSTNFPTANALQSSIGGSVDAFVAKINAAGSALVYSTYLGGSAIDGGTAIAVDSAGSPYVAGFTGSANFPTINPVQQANAGGSFDAFVAKLSPSGAALEWSTYLGGSGVDAGFGIAVDSSGTAFVMGQTVSTDFPTASPLQPANGGGASDLFIAKIVLIGVTGPHIAGASVSGKRLLVFGSGFDSGAKILLNDEPQKTSNDEQNAATALIAKKSGKMIAPGQTVMLQVRNSDGTLSNQFSFTK